MKWTKLIKAKKIDDTTIMHSSVKILYLYGNRFDGFPRYIINKAKNILKKYEIELHNMYINDTIEYTVVYTYNSNLDEDTLTEAFGDLYYSLEAIFKKDEEKDFNEEEVEDWGF